MRRLLQHAGARILVALCFCAVSWPAWAVNQARPGTLNYVEGNASIDGAPISQKSVGKTELEPDQALTTGNGKVEVLLTPGVFLRLDANSTLKMISPNLTFTQVALERGRASIEVDQIMRQNNIQIVQNGIPTQLLKTGYYEFNANRNTAMVFHGKAAVIEGDNRFVVLKNHHETELAEGAASKPTSFNTRHAQDDLYNWSSLRSQYLAGSNAQIAGMYSGGSYLSPGWYWNPYAYDYAFFGMDPFFSPFGWGFYPPWYFGGGFYGGYGAGFYGTGFYGRGFRGYGPGPRGANPRFGGGGFRGGAPGGGFHGGGIGSGGFHGGGGMGGGGFHGGGGGGGFHGGGGGRR